ncbi:putative isoamyl alcohol oxidase [Thozetella sp. PMI_491]|nr:putative isoamyl alcohol oxidase [Thozetella sp. PMI_491]
MHCSLITTSLICKVSPLDLGWPSASDWEGLNSTIGGSLIRTAPVASSCYPGNPFHSTEDCDYVIKNWGYSAYHSSLPESIDYPMWANNSCLPPNATGYSEQNGCTVGGAPQYIVNATTPQQISSALEWAAQRNIRVVVKGTGHDLNGRSSGAFSLSIWTRNFRGLSHDPTWQLPDGNGTANVLIAGSGNNWGEALPFALARGRVAVTGVDKTVGLGGYIQGGGHGPMSSTYGLAADQVLQATVVTTTGDILVSNAAQNQDLFWAIRGGGGGQYGVVVEYVIRTYPEPQNMVASSVSIIAIRNGTEDVNYNATWDALAVFLARMPDLMDLGIAGSGLAATGSTAQRVLGLESAPSGIVLSFNLWTFNSTVEAFEDRMEPLRQAMLNAVGGASENITISISEPAVTPNYTVFFEAINASPSLAGSGGVSSSRLLGRAELSDRPTSEVRGYLEQLMETQVAGSGNMLTIGLQGGPGPRNIPEDQRGAANPVWQSAYVHMLAGGSSADLSTGKTPGRALRDAADWTGKHQEERVWRQWAPDTGAYMNEANPYDTEWQHDFYGENYARLLAVKQRYDPSESLFVLAGVGTEGWDYDLDTGKLCKTS